MKLPVESPHWIAYDVALQEAVERYRSTTLAIAKLDVALASGRIRCKIERFRAEPIMVKRSDRVAVAHFPPELRESIWDEGPAIYLNDEPQSGWLFLWSIDLTKYFSKIVLGSAGKSVEVQKTPTALGRPPLHDWPEIEKIARRIHLKFPELTRTAVIGKLQDYLEADRKKVPALNQLQPLVNEIFGRT